MLLNQFQLNAAKQRYDDRAHIREHNLRLISEGRLLAVDSAERVQKFLAHHGFQPQDAAEFLRSRGRSLPVASRPVSGVREPFALERVLGTNDLMGVAFLERGLRVARTVGRIWIAVSAGQPTGFATGFMISPTLLMTNHHVLGNKDEARRSRIEFQYQLDADGRLLPTSSFAVDADTFHFADEHLDYAVVAVRSANESGARLSDFGWNRLIEAEGKAIAAQWINIIQHPNAEPKQLALRENQVIDMLDEFIQYHTDTAPGSSGSPLYNDRWEVVGLHHAGVPATNKAGQTLAIDGRVWREEMGEDRVKWIANEGVRLSRIIGHLRKQKMTAAQSRLFDEMLSAAPPPPTASPADSPAQPADSKPAELSAPDAGTATWTIPLTVAVRMGDFRSTGCVAAPAISGPPAASDEASVLAAAQQEFGRRSDVLGVEMGYVFRDGWITKERAIVVTVPQRKTRAALDEANIVPLPDRFAGYPVQVTNPTLPDLIRQAHGPAAVEAAFGRATLQPEEVKYAPPAGAKLKSVTAAMRVIAHVSPDAGWPTLKEFLAGTKKRLVVGMYDFGAPHIEKAFESAGRTAGFKKLTLVLQPGQSGSKTDNLTDREVVKKLSAALGKQKFENAWVRIGSVDGWVASAYHIKVIVRDSQALWLSSGNLQTSNQPDVAPLTEDPPKRKWLTQYNRDWHVVIENPELAQAYEKYLQNDFAHNRDFIPKDELVLPELLVPQSFFVPVADEAARPFKYFQPCDLRRKFTVQPLLTPDNYLEHVLPLINSAQSELLIQNQTFNAPESGEKALNDLMGAILAKQQARVRVRIIFRVLDAANARKTLSALQYFGFDARDIKLQRNCHTKAIIADRARVLLGSQNLSNDGISVNRDASVLFDDAELAKYFAGIFDHDWQNLAVQNIGNESAGVVAAKVDERTPPGMIRLTAKEYLEMR